MREARVIRDDDSKPDGTSGSEPETDESQRDQLLWEIEVLKARVAELEAQLVKVTKQRDQALGALGASNPPTAPAADDDVGTESWLPQNSCRYCDGEGVIWVHDFRMDCKRCGGTGIARDEH
jgi:hypothetical protein